MFNKAMRELKDKEIEHDRYDRRALSLVSSDKPAIM